MGLEDEKMDRDTMLGRLEEGEDPLELSIEKWEDIVEGVGFEDGIDNCALCEKYREYECAGCPIDDSGNWGCEGTPYGEISDHMIDCEDCKHYDENGDLLDEPIYCEEALVIAQRELDFLRSLRVGNILDKVKKITNKIFDEVCFFDQITTADFGQGDNVLATRKKIFDLLDEIDELVKRNEQ